VTASSIFEKVFKMLCFGLKTLEITVNPFLVSINYLRLDLISLRRFLERKTVSSV